MVRNEAGSSPPRVNIIERGESFVTRANLIACVHGTMKGGTLKDYASILAVELQFLSQDTKRRRARMAQIKLQFTSEGTSPEVVDLAPRNIDFDYTRSSTWSQELNVEFPGLLSVGRSTTRETDIYYSGQVIGDVLPSDGTAQPPISTNESPNGARWIVREKGSSRTGITDNLTVVVLLKRVNQKPFRMTPAIDVKISGFAFEEALASGRLKHDSVMIDPKLAFKTLKLPFNLPDIDQCNLDDFWKGHIDKLRDVHFISHVALRGGDLRSDNAAPAADGEQTTEATAVTPLEHTTSATQNHQHSESQNKFGETIAGSLYAELWNINAKDRRAMGPSIPWREHPDSKQYEEKLRGCFSWLNDELELPSVSEMKGKQEGFQNNIAEDTDHEAQHRLTEVTESTHNLCSLLVHKAVNQTSFKTFQDLGTKLLKEHTIALIAEVFALEARQYNGFRKLKFGSCEFLSSGEGKELSTCYIIQTPYYSRGFWSMLLVGRADPKDPNRARKLSGLIQSGSDVKLEKILDSTMSRANQFSYHPLSLPYHLYVNHCEETSERFGEVLSEIERVEERIKRALGKNQSSSEVHSTAEEDVKVEPSHWGLATLGESLHKASMEVAELARRQRFEVDLATALKDELENKRPTQGGIYGGVTRYDRMAKSHQSDIKGMPDRIDSLKNLLYSMIAQQDNVLSIKLAKEGLADSKAMKTLSLITILFLPGTFVATIFTTELVSFQDSAAETRAYIKVVVPLTVGLMIIYGLWLWKAPSWSRARQGIRDQEAGNLRLSYNNSDAVHKTAKQS